MHNIVLDIESYYDTKEFTLRKMSMLEYIRDSRFSFHGLGFMWVTEEGMAEPGWVTKGDLKTWINGIDWSNVAVIGHNLKFDMFALRTYFGTTPKRYIDTKGISRSVLGKSIKNHSLATIAEHFGLVPKGTMRTDGIRDLTVAQEVELAEYCIHDVELTGQIYHTLIKDFPANELDALHQTIQMFVEPKLALDTAILATTAESERQRKATIFDSLNIEKAVFSSNKKFPTLLLAEGFEVPEKPSPKQKDANGNALMIPAIALGDPDFLDMAESPNERLKSLCEARIAAKGTLLETRSEKLSKIGATGLWSFDVEYSGANQTHRYSGGSGAGGNPQNFTRGSALRAAVKAPEGYSLIVGDFSNIELRLVAYLSKDPGLITAIEEDRDIYCDFASAFYGRVITKKDEKERRFGKTAILGLGYGMGAGKFQKTVRLQTGDAITFDDAERAVDLYRTKYSRVPELWYRLNSSIPAIAGDHDGLLIGLPIRHTKNALVLPSGLKMQYPNLRQRQGEKGQEWIYDTWTKKKSGVEIVKLYGGKVLENIAQGLAGELCKSVAIQFGDKVSGLIHDEIHLVVRKGQDQMWKRKLEIAMTTPPDWMPNISLKAEVASGDNWLAAK